MLRPYQQRSIDQLYGWLDAGNKGHPCLVLPTGAGKSHIVAALCKDVLQNWPEMRVLMLTHQKELIEQNAEKMRQHWRGAPLGIYSASLRKRDIGEPITFAGIQSVRNKPEVLGHVDIVIVDECHLISNSESGGYRKLLASLMNINPHMRVIGLSATPYRLGQGLLTEGKEALFSGLIEPVSIEELIHNGFLARLTSKATDSKLDTSGVKKRGGDFVESDLQKAVDIEPLNFSIVDEVISRAGDRKSWLFFCAGVDHAEHIKDALVVRGIHAECVTGGTPKGERERILREFKAGNIQALTNANILTTGFDAPNIDLIAMLRPTMSPALYVQMAGRGLRVKDHTDHCLVLDFAGCVRTHGPITAVRPPDPKGNKGGEAPVKLCPECSEVLALSTMTCPECGHIFKKPEPDEKDLKLHEDDIMGFEPVEMNVTGWRWMPHVSRSSGKEMIKAIYYGGLSDPMVTEYFPITHAGPAGNKAIRSIVDIAARAKTELPDELDIAELSARLTKGIAPKSIHYRAEGRFFSVVDRQWAGY